MDWQQELYVGNEKPLDRLVEGYSHTSIFRTVAFIGDSLSSGEFENRDENGNPTYHDMFEYSWGQFIARKNGLKAYNFSRGGMTAGEYLNSFAEDKGYWDADKQCQAYVIALGVNDIINNQSIEIGSMADIDPQDYHNNKPTFLGCYAAIISRYKEISPDAKFFFVTFPKAANPSAQAKTDAVVKALYEMTELFSNSYVIDLYQYGPDYDDAFREKYYLYGHMSPAGYLLTAKLIDSYIDYIIRHNPDDFKMVGFIGSNR